jgi:hypothetical protein
MEDQRGIKHEHSPSTERSPSPSDAKTPLSVPSGSLPPLESPPEISSHRPCSPVFEQDGPSKKVPMIDLFLSSDEENFITNSSHDVEFTRKLFGDLNRNILGLPDVGKVIIINDYDEEEEAQEEKTASTKPMATSTAVNPASIASADANDAPAGAKMIIVMIRDPIRRLAVATTAEVAPVSLRLSRRRPRC